MPEQTPQRMHSVLMRLWLALPDWVFRVLGAMVFLILILPDARAFCTDFWSAGAWFQVDIKDPATRISVPWGQLLVDLTYLLIAISFIARVPPRRRAARSREIVLPFIAAFWPFVPWMILRYAQWTHAAWLGPYAVFMRDLTRWTVPRFITGSILIVCGNTLDVWGYATLLRSLSIVAEARELKVKGPYRFVRHPIYLGQMIAQAGVWLFYANRHVVWILFWACFVLMQLYRSRVEDEVLEQAFGERYAAWKRQTFWFV